MTSSVQPTRLALIGVGRWGRNIVSTISALDGAVLTAVGSRNPETSALVGPDCRIEADWRNLLNTSEVDGVIIAVPPAQHYELCRAALDRGVPVLIEKPLTLDTEQADALSEATQATGVLVMVDHINLFNAGYRALKRHLAEAGQVRAIRSVLGSWGPFRQDISVLWDWGPHPVSMCIDLLGANSSNFEVEDCVSHIHVSEKHGEFVEVRLNIGAKVEVEFRIGNTISPKTNFLAVHCERQVLLFDDLAENPLTVYEPTEDFVSPEGTGQAVDVAGEMPLATVISEFVSAIRAESMDQSQLYLGVEVVRVLEQCQQIMRGAAGSNLANGLA